MPQNVEVIQVVEAPIEAVWDRYTDHVSWTEWAGMGRVRLERLGNPPPNGVGALRVITNAGLGVHEEVLSFDRPHRMTYRVVKGGLPIREHLGEVVFEPHGRGTLIIWRCRFESRVPGLGGLFQLLITHLFRRALANLARQPFAAGSARHGAGAAG